MEVPRKVAGVLANRHFTNFFFYGLQDPSLLFKCQISV